VSPHLPFIQPKKYWDMYDHDAIKLANNVYQPKNAPDIAIEAQHNSAELRKNYLDIPENGKLDNELSRNLIHGYYASVTYMDALIGELITNLDELGLRENTTIVLWSDHGYFLGEHGFWCKHSTFQEAVKIPFLISHPNFIKNQTTESFTELVDLYPTLCEISNIKAPSYLQGESLVPVLKNPKKILKSEIYTRYKQGEAIIDKDFSYTEFYEGNNYLGNMLYDNHSDIKQNYDISKVDGNSKTVEKYKQKLKIMREFVNKKPI
jgi:arylsulfatase A-like enzyme